MRLMLHATDAEQVLPAGDLSKTLDHGTLTIGRSPDNDWVLPDPELIISSRHCSIQASGGRYLLTDTSSNGVFLNTDSSPIGRGNSTALENGDEIRIGRFRFVVTLTGDEVAPSMPRDVDKEIQQYPDFDDPFHTSDGAITGAGPQLGGIIDDPSSTPTPEVGPEIEQGADRSASEYFGPLAEPKRSHQDAAAVGDVAFDHEFFKPPEAVPAIPEDWNASPAVENEQLADGIGSSPAALPKEPPRQSIGLDATEAGVRSRPAGSSSEDRVFSAFLEGCGIQNAEITDDEAAEVMRLVGAFYRETVQSLMEVLSARSSIKSEFRLTQTTIKPADNNPLKFSLSLEDAMINLLTTKEGKGYLSPLKAVEEAFDDIKVHQVAVMVGMQAALMRLLKRIDPRRIEELVDQDGISIAGALQSKDARCWKEFAKLYSKLAEEAEDDFQGLFGREFARAYESHLQRQMRRKE